MKIKIKKSNLNSNWINLIFKSYIILLLEYQKIQKKLEIIK